MAGNTITGRAKKYDGTAIDYVSIFNWNDGKCIAQVVPDISGNWQYKYTKDLQVGLTYVADGCEPITHGSYYFEFLDSVVALLHFDGDDNAQSYIDVMGHTFIGAGSPTLTTLQSKFGASSLQLSATNGNNIACTHSDFIFSTDDYTIECFFKVAGGNNNIFACDAGGLYINDSANLATLYANNSNVLSKSGVSKNTWMHVALVRSNNIVYIFLNGEKSSGWVDSRNHNTGFIKIGGSTVGYGGLYFVDEFRITKGVARYTENFTPPTEPFSF